MKILGNLYTCSEGIENFASRFKHPQKFDFLMNLCQNLDKFLNQPEVLGIYKCPYEGIKCLLILISKNEKKSILIEQLWLSIFKNCS